MQQKIFEWIQTTHTCLKFAILIGWVGGIGVNSLIWIMEWLREVGKGGTRSLFFGSGF